MSQPLDFLVRKDDFRSTRIDPAPAPELAAGQALLGVDRFAFTANNVSYALIGEQLGYWKFFPAPEGWGRIPVWGYADVLRSRAEGVAEGERVFGYLPMSSHCVVEARAAGRSGFADAAPHRASLPSVYNFYSSAKANPRYRPEREDQEMLLYPLFMTGFVLDDYLADNGFFGAATAVLSSASSKTALGTATLLARRAERPRIVGLTSAGNRAFVEKLGCYDRVVDYSGLDALTGDSPSLFVDFAGNRQVVSRVHERLGDSLRESIIVGGTHWEQGGRGDPLPGPRPSVFFAPNQIDKRRRDWGGDGLGQRFGEAWSGLLDTSDGWLRIERQSGAQAVERVYRDTLEGRVPPDVGNVLSLSVD